MDNTGNPKQQNDSLLNQVQEELCHSEERARLINENIPCAVYSIEATEQGTEFYISERIKDIIGYSAGEVMKDYTFWTTLTHPDDRDTVSKKFKEHKANMTPLDIEFRVIAKDGSTKWIRIKALLNFDKTHNITRGNGFIEDITERRNIEEKLRKTQKLLEDTQSIIKLGGWEYDVACRKMTWTDEIYNIYGLSHDYDPSDIRRNVQFYTPESQLFARVALQNAIKYGKPYDLELEIVRPDGKHIWVRTIAKPVLENEKVVRIIGNFMDITELKESEEQMRILAGLTEISPAWITVHDLDGSFLYANQRTLEAHGYTKEEFFKLNLKDIDTPESARQIKQRVKEILASGEATLEVIHRRKDGTSLPLELYTKLMEWKGKRVILSVGIDITERQKAEKTLRESEQRFKDIARSAAEFIWESDRDGKFKFITERAESIYGLPLSEIIGHESFEFMPADVAKRISKILQDAARNRKPFHNLEHRLKKPDGSEAWLMISGVPYVDEKGRFLGYRGTGAEITAQKTAQEALRESEEKYRKLFENANEGIMIIQNRFPVFTNPMSSTITGYTAEELTDKRFSEIVHPDDKEMVWERYTRRMNGEKVPSNYSLRIINKDGESRWINMNVVLINWNGKPATLNFITDITDQKLLEEERQRVEKLESIGIMAGGIAHDFNNLLTAILGNISLVKMVTELKGEAQDLLMEAEKASLRAKGLTQQLLTFSKGGAPVKKSMSIADVLKEAAGFTLRGSNIKCRFSIPEDLWNVEVDEGQFTQVINNLVLNAQQSMPTGGNIEINAENVSLTAKYKKQKRLSLKTGDYIKIAIADHGIGIPAEYLDKIFDPFFTTKQKGSGLGLSTTYSIIKNHEGHINVESETGKGTTFTIYLPAIKKKLEQQDTSVQKKKLARGRVLIMDDEKAVREILGKILGHLGYKDITHAPEGNEAVRLFKEARESGKPFSLVILDLTVPGGMGGRDTMEQLRKIEPGVKAIVSSGYSTEQVLSNYKKYGFSGVVTKPYNIDQLQEVLQEIDSDNS